jgi:hypothetical protein
MLPGKIRSLSRLHSLTSTVILLEAGGQLKLLEVEKLLKGGGGGGGSCHDPAME